MTFDFGSASDSNSLFGFFAYVWRSIFSLFTTINIKFGNFTFSLFDFALSLLIMSVVMLLLLNTIKSAGTSIGDNQRHLGKTVFKAVRDGNKKDGK